MSKLTVICSLSLTAILSAGCALPVPLQVASWALDGISYVMTEKSVTDHGLSAVVQKDCAVWRGFTEGELCRDWGSEQGTLLAAVSKINDKPNKSISPVTDDNRKSIRQSAAVNAGQAFRAHLSRPTPPSSSQRPSLVQLAKRQDEPAAGIYFVIGSFRTREGAVNLAENHSVLLPTVLTARLQKKSVYRVVIGPVEPGREQAWHSQITKNGFQDIWAIRVQPSDWSLAYGRLKQVRRASENPELAKLIR